MLVPVPVPPTASPPSSPRVALVIGRRSRTQLQLVVVFSPPAPPASVAGGAA